MNLTPGEVNFIEKGTTIYKLGEKVESIGFLIEGNITKSTMQASEEIPPGRFIGVHSLYTGKFTSTFTAETDVSIRIIKADSPSALANFLTENPQIHERMITDLSILLSQLADIYNKLYTQAVIINNSNKSIYEQFKSLSDENDFNCDSISDENNFESFSFSSQGFYKDFLEFQEYNENPQKAYTDMRSGKDKLFSTQAYLIRDIYAAYDELVHYVVTLTNHLAGNNACSIINYMSELAGFLSSNNESIETVVNLMKKLLESVKAIEFSLKRTCMLPITFDYFYINKCIKNAGNKSFSTVQKSKKNVDPENTPLDEPKEIPSGGSLEKIMAYAEYTEEQRENFLGHLSDFVSIPDKFSKKDEDRKVFKKISEKYYELYETVFLKYVDDPDDDLIIDMFLNFGFLDETLLTENELEYLFNIDYNIIESFPCKIFRMKEWLTDVYFGREFASKNEFDEDYNDHVRMEKKLKGFSKEQEKKMLEDKVARVKYEIQNMLKYSSRLLNGRMLTFVPFLYSEGFESTMEKMYLKPESINEMIASIRAIDYSLFYREFMYADRECRIDKEMIQKEVFPIIILFPVAGQNGIMWQETTRKRSDSPGRFFMPSFFIGNLEDTMLRILGRFRWELCKQMMGLSWNNIQNPSLTSRYFDYVQFYKKENELSSEKKEALKSQISKCRNKMNEVFITDYMVWIKNESKGAIRLNSVARRILATHCPFSKEIREKLEKQPLFEKAMVRYKLDKAKKIKELRNRYLALEKRKATFTKELLDTQRFYTDL